MELNNGTKFMIGVLSVELLTILSTLSVASRFGRTATFFCILATGAYFGKIFLDWAE